ncbi:tetratricopeptide repeat protein 27 homolog [Phtheirospermum japonicum]|uniref:Tetratricopeptide repeat protein 27 homolog n=1 Tax=Phtheirospermum japonicum TaxID=374723 RepID=A0A830BGP1_9LAMI|nr:tetratricopeptide repeat protein 27 homolog [Phtheirospermum japonicum]
MAANDVVLLRSLELRLLRCSLPSDNPSRPPSPTQPSPSIASRFPHLYSLLNGVVALIESGFYLQALSSSPASQALFSNLQFDSSESADHFYSETLPNCISSVLNVNCDEDLLELGYKSLLVMAIGVAALLAFTQCNITGPLDNIPLMPLAELLIPKNETGGSDWMEWEAWAQKELMSVGSDLRAKFSNLQYLIFGKTLLMSMRDLLFQGNFSSIDGVRSITWWLARALFLHQKLLDERSSVLFDLLQVLTHESLFHFGTLEKTKDYWCANEDCSTILPMLHLELGILELYYGRVDTSKLRFESAAEMSNYNFFVSGALGFRTRHQVAPKAQLRLVVGTNGGDTSAPLLHDSSTTNTPQLSETDEASDVLMAPRFVEDDINTESVEHDGQYHSIGGSQLKAVHQAVMLAQCLSILKNARNDDEFSKWEMAPYIEAISSQDSSPFLLRCYCNILRVRWESSRGRTKQRALMMMEKLVEGINNHSPGVAHRLHYCFGVNMPPIPVLRKEYGDLLVSCGLIGEAIQIYEGLELWDNLIHCFQLMNKKAAAVELINKRLTENPSDPRLWCSLGDVTNDDASYEKALEVSANRSARAFRSLARSAYNREEYEKSKLLWDSAMRLNSLHPDGWFALGAAALKSRDVDKALDSFTRAVQLDPDNGEAWNNIACLHMIKKRSKESFVAFKEALKLKRDSWQMWENYSHVAADVGNFSQAMEAVQKVFDMSKKKRIDSELLERIMLEIEKQTSVSVSAKNRETEHLIELLGRILRQVVQHGGSAETWGLYARWHKLKGDLTMCSEALLKQVRSYQGSDLWKDRDRFVRFARASLELCKVYRELASGGSSRRELFAAEMHLKNTIKQAREFCDTDEYRELVACLEDVQGELKDV